MEAANIQTYPDQTDLDYKEMCQNLLNQNQRLKERFIKARASELDKILIFKQTQKLEQNLVSLEECNSRLRSEILVAEKKINLRDEDLRKMDTIIAKLGRRNKALTLENENPPIVSKLEEIILIKTKLVARKSTEISQKDEIIKNQKSTLYKLKKKINRLKIKNSEIKEKKPPITLSKPVSEIRIQTALSDISYLCRELSYDLQTLNNFMHWEENNLFNDINRAREALKNDNLSLCDNLLFQLRIIETEHAGINAELTKGARYHIEDLKKEYLKVRQL